MAKSNRDNVILLGYEDEMVSEKHKSTLGYWSNKVGGRPDWPIEGISSPNCRLCGLEQLLVVQIYAPLENSPFHRTLYIFSCINPNCWNHNESWTCLRSQLLDLETSTPMVKANPSLNTEWCEGENDWGDEDVDNGNVIRSVNRHNSSDCESDDDSCSLSGMIGHLNVNECNANWDNLEQSSGAVGKQMSPVASAEIEKEENEVISIDTPMVPQENLLALFQETAPVPYCMRVGERNQNNSVSFVSFFISVGEEGSINCQSEHVRELIQEYKRIHGDTLHHGINQGRDESGAASEEYERAIPAHGDKMFHHFLSKIQDNPGQIIRYSRESKSPLLIYPLQEIPKRCQHCKGDLVFELQLLPTLIPKLKFPDDNETRVEFGTALIFTCRKSCWSENDKFREEKVIVQLEKT